MVGALISRVVVLVFGTIYPAYASYKAVKSANVRQYVHWMMYWVVFALFITIETFTDIFISWLPMYYEIKVAFVLWLLSPYSRGSGFIYRKFIHPTLSNHEKEIDEFLTSAKTQSYSTMVTVGTKGINLAASAMATAALKSQEVVADRLRSYSMNDLSRLPDNMPIHNQPRMQHETYAQQSNAHLYSNLAIPTQSGPVTVYPNQVIVREPLQPIRGAVSMMDLSRNEERDFTNFEEFDTSPRTTTADDMELVHHPSLSKDTSPYATLPRHRNKKKDKSPSLRRSKRKGKVKNYSEDDESGQ